MKKLLTFVAIGCFCLSGFIFLSGAINNKSNQPNSNSCFGGINFPEATTGWVQLGLGTISNVNAIAINGTDVYVGGPFLEMDGDPSIVRLARWDGSSWHAMTFPHPDSVINGGVNAIAVNGNDVYICGTFSMIGSLVVNRVAKWDGTSWSALGSGTNGPVNAIAVSGNDVYVAGSFSMAGGITVNRVAKWDGSTWSALGTGVGTPVVNGMAVSGNDVYVVGGFSTAGGNPASRVAKWDGTSWSALGTGTTLGTPDVVISNGFDVYAGGNITSVGGTSTGRIAKWDGSNWSALGLGVHGSGSVQTIVVNGNELYIGGGFTVAGGDSSLQRLAKWDGSNWSHVVGSGGANSFVRALAIQGNTLYAGGSFTVIGGDSINRIGKYSLDGSSPSSASGNSIVSGGGIVNFPSTAVSVSINPGYGAGHVNVFKYDDSPSDVGGIPISHNISNYRWIIQQTNIATPFTGTMRVKIDDIPGNGITDPTTVQVYHRPTPGQGNFTEILGVTYDGIDNELVIPITTFSEFVFASEDNPLPVDLISFTAQVERNDVMLSWTTAWEENNQKFDIQRKITDTEEWQIVGSVNGSGTVYEEKIYSFTDKNLVTGKYEYRLVQFDYDGNSTADFDLNQVVSIGIPTHFDLSQNYPNPFNPVTKINYEIPVESHVRLSVFDMTGREITTLVNSTIIPGYYTTEFNGSSFASGVYFYRLVIGNSVLTKKMTLIK